VPLRAPRSAIALANTHVPFEKAAAWAGVDTGTRSRGMKAGCPMCGADGAFRVYPDHGYCFGERAYVTVVTLLSFIWEMEREDAALKALDKIGYVPVSYAHLWEHAQRQPEVARDMLAEALRTWCSASFPDWQARQFDPAVAGQLSRCLGLLPRVASEQDCDMWLDGCKQAMRLVFPPGSRE
jgi:hypothetical protein